jgi:hypothetical protein
MAPKLAALSSAVFPETRIGSNEIEDVVISTLRSIRWPNGLAAAVTRTTDVFTDGGNDLRHPSSRAHGAGPQMIRWR